MTIELFVNGDFAAVFDTQPYFIEELTAGWLYANEIIENGYELPEVEFTDGKIYAKVIQNDKGILPCDEPVVCLSDVETWLSEVRRKAEGRGVAGFVNGQCVAFFDDDAYCALLRVIGKRVLKPAGVGDLVPVTAQNITEEMVRACVLAGIRAIAGYSEDAAEFAQDNDLLIIP